MGDRHFSPAEVEALIPVLTEIMEGLMAAQAEASTLQEGMNRERQRITLSGGGVVDRQAWRAERARLDALTRRVQDGLSRIQTLGGVPKDVSLGLVDFPHRRAGEVVNLCWKFGEREIRFWHRLDEGYAGRKPL